jgi:hypothetical protein
VIGQGDGDRQAWQGAPYSAPGVDDVAFTHDLLDHLEAGLCVDERRVYAPLNDRWNWCLGDRSVVLAPVPVISSSEIA